MTSSGRQITHQGQKKTSQQVKNKMFFHSFLSKSLSLTLHSIERKIVSYLFSLYFSLFLSLRERNWPVFGMEQPRTFQARSYSLNPPVKSPEGLGWVLVVGNLLIPNCIFGLKTKEENHYKAKKES